MGLVMAWLWKVAGFVWSPMQGSPPAHFFQVSEVYRHTLAEGNYPLLNRVLLWILTLDG